MVYIILMSDKKKNSNLDINNSLLKRKMARKTKPKQPEVSFKEFDLQKFRQRMLNQMELESNKYLIY